jgi:5-formyltetrahydrofolate cyclo-ligase
MAVNSQKTAKGSLRKKISNLLRNQKEDERFSKSRIIHKKLCGTPEFRNAKTILFYASFDGEVDTFSMMKQALRLGKKVALPKIVEDRKKMMFCFIEDLENDLAVGSYGILEPTQKCPPLLTQGEIDLVIVPGVAFDKKNYRLGRGGGYYDRFLKKLPSETPSFGLAFDFQIVGRLPAHQDFDIPVHRVIAN